MYRTVYFWLILTLLNLTRFVQANDNWMCFTYSNCRDCINNQYDLDCAWNNVLNFCFNLTASNKTDTESTTIHSVSNCPTPAPTAVNCYGYSNCNECLQHKDCAWSKWNYCFPENHSFNEDSINSTDQCPAVATSTNCYSYSNCRQCVQYTDCSWSEWNYCFPRDKPYNGDFANTQSECTAYGYSYSSVGSATIIVSIVVAVAFFITVCCVVGCCVYKKKKVSKSYQSVNRTDEDEQNEIANIVTECNPQIQYTQQPQAEQQHVVVIPTQNQQLQNPNAAPQIIFTQTQQPIYPAPSAPVYTNQ